MDMYSARRAVLRQLIDRSYRGGSNFGEKAARALEEKLKLPSYYFDVKALALLLDRGALQVMLYDEPYSAALDQIRQVMDAVDPSAHPQIVATVTGLASALPQRQKDIFRTPREGGAAA